MAPHFTFIKSVAINKDCSQSHRVKGIRIRLQLPSVIYCPNSFVLIPRHYMNLKEIRYESMSLNRIEATKSDRVVVA